MPFWKSLHDRSLEPELMDDPSLEESAHWEALRGLGTIHRWCRTVSVLGEQILSLVSREEDQPLRVLDLACGGGQVATGLREWALRKGLRFEVDGCDISPTSLAFARGLTAHRKSSPHFFRLDAVAQPLPPGYDVICSSLFLHHLSENNATSTLRKMAAAAKRAVLVIDLERTVSSYLLTRAAIPLLTSSSIVHTDGLRSVRAAFSLEELREVAKAAGLSSHSLFRRWPCGLILSWRKS